MAHSIVNISKLTKKYAATNTIAVNQLDLQIKSETIHGILGPNGAGKSTTINCIANLIEFTSGEINVAGLDIKKNPKEIKSKIGLVPQDIALYQELTAYENLIFFGNLHHISKAILKERIDDSLKRLGLYDKKDQKVKYYSGGMKRRVNLIVALLHKPELLILDEPTVGVDVQSKQVILDFLLDLNKEGMSVLYTSHMMEEAEKICHTVSIVDQGQIIEQGSPDQLKSKYSKSSLEEVFVSLTGRELRD